jgi:crotonobetainyl-CoA:carnitine CoA-transferase CaiB-like acyl-CoA transferase
MTGNLDIPALRDLRVLDLSNSMAGQFCGRLLADYGADVVLGEPAGGSPVRAAPPLTEARAAPENSLLFWHLNTGKRSRVIGDPMGADLAETQALCRAADVVLVDAEDREALGAMPGHLVVCAFSDFGDQGPYRDWTGGELIHQALSGVMYVTGSDDREPIYGLGRRSSYACGVTAYSSILAALLARARDGKGQEVEAVTFEAAAAMSQNLVSQYSFTQSYSDRSVYLGGGMVAQLELLDGWIIVWVLRNWERICEIFRLPPEVAEQYPTMASLQGNWPAAVKHLKAGAAKVRTEEVLSALQATKICAERFTGPLELLETEHFVERGCWRYLDDDGLKMLSLGPVFRTTSPSRPVVSAPRLGDCTGDPWPARKAEPSPKAAGPRNTDPPLKGVRVMDYTLAWAGPMATRSLAFLGADVIKVENASALDPWRGLVKTERGSLQHADREPGERPWNRISLFASQGHDKRSISLDLKTPRGVELARALAAESDVLLANFSPRVLDKLGLGYESLKALNPGLVFVEMPAFGNTGPSSSHVGVGKTMEAASGMATLMGYGDGVPVLTGPAYLDPVGGLHGAAAVLTALVQRARDGVGQYVEVAQVEAALHWIGEFLLDAAVNGRQFRPAGNAIPEAAPHDAFPCAGRDQWIAIAVYDDDQWAALRRLSAIAGLDDPAYATREGRRRNAEALRSLISGWTGPQDKHDLATRLQAAGVPAAPVANGADVFHDPHLRSRGLIQQLDHADVGPREYSGLAYRLSETPGAMHRGAPCFGAHGPEVLREVLDMPDAEIEALIAAGVLRLDPVR